MFFDANISEEPPEPVVVSAKQAVRSLEGQIGKKIVIDGALASSPVLIMRGSTDPTVILSKLAIALHATISNESGQIKISRTSKDEQGLASLDFQVMSNNLLQAVGRWDRDCLQAARYGSIAQQTAHFIHADAAAIGKLEQNPTSRLERGVDPMLLTPAGRLLRSMVDKVGLDALAKTKPTEIIVYSNLPTGSETPVVGCEGAIQDFIQAQQSLRDDPGVEATSEDRQKSFEGFIYSNPKAELSNLKATLTVSRLKEILNLNLEVFNGSGVRVAQSYLASAPRDHLLAFQDTRFFVQDHPKQEIEEQPQAELLFSIMESRKVKSEQMPSIPALVDWVTHPDTYDPDNFLVKDLLDAVLPTSDPSTLVAVLPDELFEAATDCHRDNRANTAAFNDRLLKACELIKSDGVTILRPVDPLWEDLFTADREKLGDALREMKRDGNIDLRTWSHLSAEMGPGFGGLAKKYAHVLKTCLDLPEFLDEGTWDEMFQSLGQIQDTDWPSEGESAFVPASDPPLQEAIWHMLMANTAGTYMTKRTEEIWAHPTQLLPNGIPPGSKIRFDYSSERVLEDIVSPTQARFVTRSLKEEVAQRAEVAYLLSPRKGLPVKLPSSSTEVMSYLDKEVPSVYYGHRSILTMNFIFSDTLKLGVRFAGISQLSDAPHHFADMPEDLQKEVYEVWRLAIAQRVASTGKGS